jgi:hypothetical protein
MRDSFAPLPHYFLTPQLIQFPLTPALSVYLMRRYGYPITEMVETLVQDRLAAMEKTFEIATKTAEKAIETYQKTLD